MNWEAVIGLEVHIQLATQSKIFSSAPTAYGAEPNTQANAVDVAMPGVLPVINEQVIRMATLFGLAINADIAPRSVFARKHYFYPDLPKGYQISQFELPIVANGHLDITVGEGATKRIGITRAHLEEDAGKSLHDVFDRATGIDLNRAGTPLVECVSEPEISSAAEAAAYARKLHSLVTYLGICDGNMQEGSFRVDANVSVRPVGSAEFGTRTETKNVNSFRFLEKAIEYEIERQIDVIEGGGKIVQETRLFDPTTGETRSMRSKEEAHDYRYFPDPDLLPVAIDAAFIEAARAELPELPGAKAERFEAEYGLSTADAAALTASRVWADYFEATVAAAGADKAKLGKPASNWINTELAGVLNRDGLSIGEAPVSAAQLGGLIARVDDNTISGKIAKQVFDALVAGEGESADAIIEAKGLKQITDSGAIESFVDEAIANNPDQVQQYLDGKTKVVGFLVGQVMKASKGKANPKEVNQMMVEKLNAMA
ncbi:Asp-tRNA(Asn)/Glu-tRNA(Gln) amidotransferase subunit GatB [Salinisphaera hydrothermalis]|uniref:Aspartyl/glutamyl-tRNA(Asn/Gln) amidotransferase subunit B n=1 Tax=Salinisphaera hydrothermalis (strain C41B8) TaxID=1304275 RepID=A0A084IL20_SALHC|nr:Asp-tRNA(Asn)/Glu-tRNA(Gln) amidotransferase subunit GatB [Salinisphaera hydrothermalis]KEZ77404.1 glutamyl-tRNA(Gln) amidotransferase subunit beta [Salinisphaera hydrothermalis C41B8]